MRRQDQTARKSQGRIRSNDRQISISDWLGIISRSMKYHIWTEGCQMNVADSQRVGSSLEHLGYVFTEMPEEADVIVLNTCVVRQSAEDKALGRLTSLRPLKKQNPDLVINLMGCMVGVRGAEKLRQKLPFVDVFSPPSDPGPLVSFLTPGRNPLHRIG